MFNFDEYFYQLPFEMRLKGDIGTRNDYLPKNVKMF